MWEQILSHHPLLCASRMCGAVFWQTVHSRCQVLLYHINWPNTCWWDYNWAIIPNRKFGWFAEKFKLAIYSEIYVMTDIYKSCTVNCRKQIQADVGLNPQSLPLTVNNAHVHEFTHLWYISMCKCTYARYALTLKLIVQFWMLQCYMDWSWEMWRTKCLSYVVT